MWQQLRQELYPLGLEIVTVALDTAGIEAVRPFIEQARPQHPSLLDQAHLLDELFGIVNVPSGIWINEDGLIVRPPEPAYPARPSFLDTELADDASPELKERVADVKKIKVEPEKYVDALRDWAEHGSTSRYALTAEEVLERSRPRPYEEALAAAHFELGQHLYQRLGSSQEAIFHFQLSHKLQPDNWTYRRQAWNLLSPDLNAKAVYGSDFISDLRKIGAENFYPPLQMD